MEGHYPASRDELFHVQMDVKHVQSVQSNHSDRITRLEKRQADDAALKSVWNSPFPSVIGGTPQHGPIHTPQADVFDDFDDDQGQNLIGSLQLDAEEEPVRRGASRANSVRFDVSALHGANWASTGSRSSGEFGPVTRPNSGFGGHPIERSASHKSDGRHSSAGHSVHSGRTSSLGLDTNFHIGDRDEDDSPIDVPAPPPGLFVLGSVPSIIRCWLGENFSHNALLYAVVCTGSQKSTIEYNLVKELGLLAAIEKNSTGVSIIRLPVYLPEAIVTHPSSRANSPAPQLPTFTTTFEVIGSSRSSLSKRRTIRVFIGSDTLRIHSADVLLSQNLMTLYGDDRVKLTVPFVRPEDDATFKDITTTNLPLERVELKATAVEFKPSNEVRSAIAVREPITPAAGLAESVAAVKVDIPAPQSEPHSLSMEDFEENRTSEVIPMPSENVSAHSTGAEDESKLAEGEKREASGIWGSWRSGGATSSTDTDGGRDTLRAGRGGRSMKVLKPSRVTSGTRSTSTARTGPSYEPAAPRSSIEARRRSGGGYADSTTMLRWDVKKGPLEDRTPKDPKLVSGVSKTSNPVGGASAFAWMNSARPKSGTTAGD